MADVRLSDDDVVLEGNRVRCVATDLILDHPARRAPGSAGERRALVHYDDGLVVNWGDDYPGGVTIRGPVRFTGNIEKAEVEDISVKLHKPRRSFVLEKPGLIGGISLDPTAPDPTPDPGPGTPRLKTFTHVDLASELEDLREMVVKLGERVAALEDDSP